MNNQRQIFGFVNCAVIVAHPDDETLWAGGTILMHPKIKWAIVTLCRKSDPDRAPRFYSALKRLNATGTMADLDDGPEQNPLDNSYVQKTILQLLHSVKFDLIITHGTKGEYTRHRRHEETARAVRTLWKTGNLQAQQLWMFAYEDGKKKYLPRPIENADIFIGLPKEIWQRKYNIITKIYGFDSESFEAKTTPRKESFWCFNTSG
jgi:LmbE family N-acetylglucosaminyl deacetylase